MGLLGRLFGERSEKRNSIDSTKEQNVDEIKTDSSKEVNVDETKVDKKYEQFVVDVSFDPETELVNDGPQVFVCMHNGEDTRAVARNLPAQVRDWLSANPGVIDFKDGTSVLHLCFTNENYIRKSVDRLFNGNHGAALSDYGLTKLGLRGFMSVDLPKADCQALVADYSGAKKAMSLGRVSWWA